MTHLLTITRHQEQDNQLTFSVYNYLQRVKLIKPFYTFLNIIFPRLALIED